MFDDITFRATSHEMIRDDIEKERNVYFMFYVFMFFCWLPISLLQHPYTCALLNPCAYIHAYVTAFGSQNALLAATVLVAHGSLLLGTPSRVGSGLESTRKSSSSR